MERTGISTKSDWKGLHTSATPVEGFGDLNVQMEHIQQWLQVSIYVVKQTKTRLNAITETKSNIFRDEGQFAIEARFNYFLLLIHHVS